MQGIVEKKEEGKKAFAKQQKAAPKEFAAHTPKEKPAAPKEFAPDLLASEPKKKQACQPLAQGLSEGPMLMKSVEESKKQDMRSRAQYEKSLLIEIAALKRRLARKKAGKKGGKGPAKRLKDDEQKDPHYDDGDEAEPGDEKGKKSPD